MTKDIIVSYDEKCKKIINELDSVKQLKNDLDEMQKKVDSFKANNSSLYKLLHPIKLIKNCSESKRIKRINKTFDGIYYSSILTYITEETGNLQEDLDNATYIVKPRHMDKYIKSLNLKK